MRQPSKGAYLIEVQRVLLMPGRLLRHQATFSQHGKCRCAKYIPTDFRSLTCCLRYLKSTLPPNSQATRTRCRQDTHCRSSPQKQGIASHVPVTSRHWSGTQLNRAQPEVLEKDGSRALEKAECLIRILQSSHSDNLIGIRSRQHQIQPCTALSWPRKHFRP